MKLRSQRELKRQSKSLISKQLPDWDGWGSTMKRFDFSEPTDTGVETIQAFLAELVQMPSITDISIMSRWAGILVRLDRDREWYQDVPTQISP